MSKAEILAAIAALVALMGFAGQLDYAANREAECAAFYQPHVWDKEADACVPDYLATPDLTSQEAYYAAPPSSSPLRHEGN